MQLRMNHSSRPFLAYRALPTILALTPALACQAPGGNAEAGNTSTPPTFSAEDLRATSPAGEEVLAQLDLSTTPCEDFYQFACGGWIENTPLPDDKPRWGRGFGELSQRNNEVLRSILEADEGRAGQYYAACMDVEAINAAGTKPLEPYLAKIDTLESLDAKGQEQLFALIGELDGTIGLGAFFSFGLSLDFENPDLQITDLGQGGTGLPDRSFYLDEGKKQQILPAYQAHVGRMLAFVGYTPEQAEAAAGRIVAFETELAKLHKPPEQMRDPKAVYNRWDRKGVEERSKLPWATYFEAVGAPDVDLINVSNPEFVEGLPTLMASADLETVKDYLRFNVISSLAGSLSDEVVQTNFMFVGALTGQKQLQPRWERCVGAANGAVGDLVSEQFIERTFAGDSKDIAIDMIQRVEAAFEAGLGELEWMDDETRGAAVGKMEKIENKIGYPEKWRTYDGLNFSGSYFADTVAARTWGNGYSLAKIGKPVDEREWSWPASIVNAGYNPLQNQMLFPAGILQPPFFNRERPAALNFGAMGMVMGHELTHGFDDSGRKFDGDGVMREWWAPAVSERFDERTQCIVDTYSAIEVQPGTNVNGELTLGENIADFGGIKESYAAYNKWLGEGEGEAPAVEGFTNQQLFFLGFAQSWCTVSSPEIDVLLATVDPHSPPKTRVNVPLAHFPGFWEAFSCGEGSAMHPPADEVCEVW